MFESLLAMFKGRMFSNLASALTHIGPLLQELDDYYDKDDKDAKNALIDMIVQILNSHKDVNHG